MSLLTSLKQHPHPQPSSSNEVSNSEPGTSQVIQETVASEAPVEPEYDPDTPPEGVGAGAEQNGDEEPEFDIGEDNYESDFPITHELVMKDHTKVISALAIDPSGARVASGSYDYDCKLWDFGGMGATARPFKTWEPAETYYVGFNLGASA